MDFPYGELVEVLAATTSTDEYHNEVEDWTDPETVDSDPRAGVEPRPSTFENTDSRNAITDGYTLYLRPGVTVTALNRVRVRGEIWQVQGPPAVWRSPLTGWEPGVVVQVGRVDG